MFKQSKLEMVCIQKKLPFEKCVAIILLGKTTQFGKKELDPKILESLIEGNLKKYSFSYEDKYKFYLRKLCQNSQYFNQEHYNKIVTLFNEIMAEAKKIKYRDLLNFWINEGHVMDNYYLNPETLEKILKREYPYK